MADLIFNPLAFPYQRAQTYADGGAPNVLSDEFYNPVQDVIGLAFGGLTGLSCSLKNEDFDYNATPVTGAGASFGQQLTISTNGAFTVQPTTLGLIAGDHGVWQVLQTGATNGTFIADEAQCWIGLRQFILATKVKVVRLAGLDTVANAGLAIGFGSALGSAPHFRAGSDAANWQTYYASAHDTGVPVTDGQWYWLILERRAGVVSYYICTPGNTPVLVYQLGVPGALADFYRLVKIKTIGSTMGDGILVDCISRGIER